MAAVLNQLNQIKKDFWKMQIFLWWTAINGILLLKKKFPFWRIFHHYCIQGFVCWSIFATATPPLLSVASLLIFHVPPTKDMQPPTASFHLAVRSRSSVTSRGSQPEQRSPASLPPAKHSQLQWLCLRLQAKLVSLITRYWTWICAGRSAFGFWNSLIAVTP